MNELELSRVFINSTTFLLWQKYCRFREKFTNTQSDIEKIITRKINNSNLKIFIIPSITFRYWLKIYLLKKSIITIIPRPVKNYIKLILSIFTFKKLDIPRKIRTEWKEWYEDRRNSSIDIINFSVISYDYRFQRPQQLAVSMGNLDNRVFYVEADFCYSLSEKLARVKVRKVAKNIYVVTLSAPVNYFIYQDTPSQKGVDILITSLKLLLSEAKILNPVAKIDHPFWGSLKDHLAMPIVYDVMDYHEGFRESGREITQKHYTLVKASDLVIATSDYLYNELRDKTSNLFVIKNAGDYDHFITSARKHSKPPLDIKDIQGPIFGYYGALAEWIDTEIIEKIALTYKESSLVFIGRCQNKELQILSDKYQNIHLLGEKSYSELPKYLSRFDVCLIPFKINELIKATNPVKIYEYFASGKPVVSTHIPELEEYKGIMYFGKTPLQFTDAIKLALNEKSKDLAIDRQKIAKANTWQMRAKTLDKLIVTKLFPKVSVIILVYNNRDLSKIAIDSVINRSLYPNMELIIVDNKSNQETIKLLDQYDRKDAVKVIYNPINYGFAKGNNIGMKLADGEYIVILNNDVRVTPGWIERLLYHLRSSNAGLVGPVTNSIGNESKIQIDYDSKKVNDIEVKSSIYTYKHWGDVLKLQNIAAFAWIMSKSIYKNIGGFDEQFGRGLFEDDDYCMRIRNAGLSVLCAEDSFVHHEGGASTVWGSTKYQELFNANKAKFEKKWNITWTPHKYRKIGGICK